MPTIEELLRKTLNGANPEYERADRDLHNEVREASAAVRNITGGLADLVLVPEEDLPDAIVYRLDLVLGNDCRELKAFGIPYLGYPIRATDSVQVLRLGYGGQVSTSVTLGYHLLECADVSSLHRLFEQMATSRDSALVRQLAYILRNRESLSAAKAEDAQSNGG